MAYAIGNVILFVAQYRNMFGEQAPHVVARAFKASERDAGMIVSGSIYEIMGGNQNLIQMFDGLVSNDHRHIVIFLSQDKPLDIELLLLALFPEEEIRPLFEEMEGDHDRLSTLIGEKLRAKDVDWEDRWIRITPAEAAPPAEPPTPGP